MIDILTVTQSDSEQFGWSRGVSEPFKSTIWQFPTTLAEKKKETERKSAPKKGGGQIDGLCQRFISPINPP